MPPDFLGYPGAIEMASDHREIVERGLRLRRAGNAIMEKLGGRAVHPVNVQVGGFYSVPAGSDLSRRKASLSAGCWGSACGWTPVPSSVRVADHSSSRGGCRNSFQDPGPAEWPKAALQRR